MNDVNEQSLNERLDCLLLLENDWDGYKAPPINEKAVIKAKEFATLLSASNKWLAVPCSSSAVQLEYHGNDFDIEIYIEAIQ